MELACLAPPFSDCCARPRPCFSAGFTSTNAYVYRLECLKLKVPGVSGGYPGWLWQGSAAGHARLPKLARAPGRASRPAERSPVWPRLCRRAWRRRRRRLSRAATWPCWAAPPSFPSELSEHAGRVLGLWLGG